MENRNLVLLNGIDLWAPGLEVSPLYRPTVKKSEANVYYTDYCSAEESRIKHSGYDHPPIMEIDFVWKPGADLRSCIPNNLKFKWAVSSHVLEHVPNPIGWMNSVLEVLEPGGVFSLALPDKRYCYDKFRNTTDVPILIDHWLRNQSIPSPYQLYDFLARSVDGSGAFGQRAFDITDNFSEARRHYTDEQALEFAINSWKNGAYYDAHCSVFTPESFVSVFRQISDLGVMNINISTPVAGHEEFFVKIEKIGDPKVKHPSSVDKSVLQSGQSYEELCLKLAHAERAFQEAVEVQQKLKKYNIFCIINNIFNRNFK